MILFIVTSLAYGGAETQMVRMALRLKSRGWEVRVVSLMPPKAYVKELESAGIQVVSLYIQKKPLDPRPILRLVWLIRSWQPNIVHSFMVHANFFARLACLLAPVPVLICSARSIDEGGQLRELLYRLTDPLCDISTQVCRACLERYVQIGAVPRNKIRYIPNGVDITRFRPDLDARKRLREDLGIEDAFVWLAVGRFDILKDYPNLFRAFSHVIHEMPKTLLVIVGDGLLRPAMEEIARDLRVKDRIKFLGICRNIPELMNAADAYVISSSQEGMANVLLEAGATGLPIVATDVGGNHEVVLDGRTGFLVPPKDSGALSKAMLRLMDLTDEERRRMGEAGHEYIEASYSLDSVVDMWEALYMEFLNKKGGKL